MTAPIFVLHPDALAAAAEAALRAIPPAWPLAATVAVNPFLGQTGEPLAIVAARLARAAGAPVTMPRSWYASRIAEGAITEADLEDARAAATPDQRPANVAAIRAALPQASPLPQPLPTVADLAAAATGIDWPAVIADRTGAWAASYFDAGQALWAAPRDHGTYAAWRAVATQDLTPEIAGLTGFARHVAEAPETAPAAIARAVARLRLPEPALEGYFHRLLTTLGGWAQYARYQLWQAELGGGTDDTLNDLLAVRLVWEEALHGLCAVQIEARWAEARAAYAAPLVPTPDQAIDAVLQEAAERAVQRGIAAALAAPAAIASDARPALQAAFCIDVRSEPFRRAFEGIDPGVRTLGFVGFFGVFAQHRRFASDVPEHRLPVLLNPGVHSCSGGPADADAEATARVTARVRRAWGRFRLAAVSSFAFVEAAGPVYAAKLLRDVLHLAPPPTPHEPAPRLDPALDLAGRLDSAEMVLRAMSMTEGFARLVLLAGHGATVVNNPYASALHCGACGGYSGEVNARLLTALLNEPEVRAGLAPRGITIPADTLFLAALHDTTTDAVTIYAEDHPSPDHADDLARARRWLAAAGAVTRGERALRLPRARGEADVSRRARDWSEVRPEWGLAGCKAFIAAPRSRTAGRSLEGQAFLHDYDWRRDTGFGVLELILTAPVVVASWISLQYYGSTVAPQTFGAGNKLLHNVVGGIGVVEGNGGMLRAGLPWQSVHDGEGLIHDPLRLSVCIEAPRAAMTDILARYDEVRALFDNRWLHLFALDEAGRMAWRYRGALAWEPVQGSTAGEELREAG